MSDVTKYQRSSPSSAGKSPGDGGMYFMRISGATGAVADDVNGRYEMTDEVSGGMPVYKKRGTEVWLEYHVSRHHGCWMSRPTHCKGQANNACYAYVDCAFNVLPDKAPSGAWFVCVNKDFVAQESVVAMPTMQPMCIDANRAYQATRAYSAPPILPERDERRATNDYGLVHLAMTITKQHVFHAIIHLLLPSEAALVLQCRKVFVSQVGRVIEAEVHRTLHALQHSPAAFPSTPPAYNLRYLHYLQQLTEALQGTAPRGFRFAVTKSACEPVPHGVDKQIYDAAKEGNLDTLLRLCQEWAGHPVIYKNSALLISAKNNHEACVRVLIAAQVDVSNSDSDGRTALHYAAYNGHASICRMLVDEGALFECKNHRNILESAKKRGNLECAAILEAAGAMLPPELAEAYAFVDEHIATTRGFRFALTKSAGEQAPYGRHNNPIYDAAKKGNLDTLLQLCQEWAGHPVIDVRDYEVSQAANTKTNSSL